MVLDAFSLDMLLAIIQLTCSCLLVCFLTSDEGAKSSDDTGDLLKCRRLCLDSREGQSVRQTAGEERMLDKPQAPSGRKRKRKE